MHDGEFEIDHALVRELVDGQFPQWRDLPISRVESSGTVHAMYRLGSDLAVRLPRLAEFTPALEREMDVLGRLAPLLPLAIPELIARGAATEAYPSTWSILRWIEGENLATDPIADPVDTATRLGRFVVAMRTVTLPGTVSINRRGRPLAVADAWTRQSIAAVAEEFDPGRLTARWDAALAVPPWDETAAWIHGDLMPGNLLASDGRLAAVIDFGECAIGNPTCDLIAGWWVFSGESRTAFREAAQADPDSWNRARGWALSGAVGALSYYVETNPSFANLARQTLRNVMSDE